MWGSYHKKFNRFTTKIFILGISHIIWKILQYEILKPELWGSPLIQEEKYQAEKTCDRRQPNGDDDNSTYNRCMPCINSRPERVLLEKTIKEAH